MKLAKHLAPEPSDVFLGSWWTDIWKHDFKMLLRVCWMCKSAILHVLANMDALLTRWLSYFRCTQVDRKPVKASKCNTITCHMNQVVVQMYWLVCRLLSPAASRPVAPSRSLWPPGAPAARRLGPPPPPSLTLRWVFCPCLIAFLSNRRYKPAGASVKLCFEG